jgi:protein SCO1/2
MSTRDKIRFPLRWVYITLGILFGGILAFAIFQPVKVVPRGAQAPQFELEGLAGEKVTPQTFAGDYVLYGFAYTADPTGALQTILAEMQAFYDQAQQANPGIALRLALVLFDEQRDTLERRQAFAASQGLAPAQWSVLGGTADALKYMIGYGFGIYYEQVPIDELAPDIQPVQGNYGYLQAQRYILVDSTHTIRAEYRIPLNMEVAMRDMRLLVREANSRGAARLVNESAHLLMCYP